MSSRQLWLSRLPASDLLTKYGFGGCPPLDGTGSAGALTPDVQPNSPPSFMSHVAAGPVLPSLLTIGNYLLTERLADSTPGVTVYKALHVVTNQEFLCRVLPLDRYQTALIPFSVVGPHSNINGVGEVLVGATSAYAMHPTSTDTAEDLHAYVRRRRRLAEPEAARLFAQALEAVAQCHHSGVVVRDIKLRRFIFGDMHRTWLKLDGLYDAVTFSGNDDYLTDKHGCLAYVSPEILDATFTGFVPASMSETLSVRAGSAPNGRYSGRAADMWSLGVMLYTMLVGRYPFADQDACVLFARIRCGRYPLPAEVLLSAPARCLIRSLLAVNPAERLTADEALSHPWFAASLSELTCPAVTSRDGDDCVVPEAESGTVDEFFVE